MMKHTRLWMLTAILTLCGTVSMNAQTKEGEWFASGRIGAGWSTFAGDVKDAKGRLGLVVGGEIGYNTTDWFAPSIGLTNTYQGVKYDMTGRTMYMDILSVPLMANFTMGPITLKAGLQPDFMLSAQIDEISYRDQLKTVSLSAPVALNWQFYEDSDGDLWFLELRYHLGLTKMNKDVMFTNGWRTPGSIRNSCLMLTIGYKCDL